MSNYVNVCSRYAFYQMNVHAVSSYVDILECLQSKHPQVNAGSNTSIPKGNLGAVVSKTLCKMQEW